MALKKLYAYTVKGKFLNLLLEINFSKINTDIKIDPPNALRTSVNGFIFVSVFPCKLTSFDIICKKYDVKRIFFTLFLNFLK